MIRLFAVVEGQTEELFVRRVLQPHLVHHGVLVDPILVTTSRDGRTGAKLGRGGGRWRHWEKDLRILLRQQRGDDVRVTTLFDLYGLPEDFPDLARLRSLRDTVQRATEAEAAMSVAVPDRRLIPYVQRHEFEALVLAALDELDALLDPGVERVGLAALRAEIAGTPPEDVNDSPATAPSKRLLRWVPGYSKTLHGPLVAEAAGLARLRAACPRFSSWLQRIETLDGGPGRP